MLGIACFTAMNPFTSLLVDSRKMHDKLDFFKFDYIFKTAKRRRIMLFILACRHDPEVGL